MKTVEDIRDFLTTFISWASEQPDVQGIALVGSYARAAARDDSDIDLVILTDQPHHGITVTNSPILSSKICANNHVTMRYFHSLFPTI